MRLRVPCRPVIYTLALSCISLSTNSVSAKNYGFAGTAPYTEEAVHDAGKVALMITNYGCFGERDWEVWNPPCEYPKGSSKYFLFVGALWIGGIIADDTLVSVGNDGWISTFEMFPEAHPAGEIVCRESGDPNAISDQDYITCFADTLTSELFVNPDPFDSRPHQPLMINLTQVSYAWADTARDDFILFECIIENIGSCVIEDGWVGIFLDFDAWHRSRRLDGFRDDLAGYLPEQRIAYTIDNDGDPDGSFWNDTSSVRESIALKVLRSIPPADDISFNWWVPEGTAIYDWGPQHMPGDRNISGGYGTPDGDAHKYRLMSNHELDYDQIFSAVDYSDSLSDAAPEGWIAPSRAGKGFADGNDPRFLYSFGPFTLMPDSTFRFFYTIVMGNNVHVNPDDFVNYFGFNNPQVFYDRLDFSELIANVAVAECLAKYFDCGDTGDCNDDGQMNVVDIIFLITYALRGGQAPAADALCPIPNRGDFNCDGYINLLDLVGMINYVFRPPARGPCDICPR